MALARGLSEGVRALAESPDSPGSKLAPPEFGYMGHATYRPPAWWQMAEPPAEIMTAIETNRLMMAHDNVLIYHVIEEQTGGHHGKSIVMPDFVTEKYRKYQAWIINVGPDAAANGWEIGRLVRVSQFAGVIVQDRVKDTTGHGRSEKTDIIRAESILCYDYGPVGGI
jgi:hypothetical protein